MTNRYQLADGSEVALLEDFEVVAACRRGWLE